MTTVKQIVNGITYIHVGGEEYIAECFPASEYWDDADVWIAEGCEIPVKVVEPAHVMTEDEYTSHILGQDNRNAAAMSSAFGRKYKKYTY